MRKIYTAVITLSLALFAFSGCSKEPSEPYYDRANKAADKAHNKLSKE